MDNHRKNYLVNRIISGRIPIKIINSFGIIEIIYYYKPSNKNKLIASELFYDLIEEYSGELLTDDELNTYLYDNDLWTEKNDSDLQTLLKDIEKLKIACYKSYLQSTTLKIAKETIVKARNEINRLYSIKNKYAHLTVTGTASLQKIKYLTGSSLYNKDGRRIFNNNNFWQQDNPILDQAISRLNQLRLEETEFRLLARTEPWRGYWSCRESCLGIFNKASVDLTDEQRELLNWSILYDGVYSHPDCPPDAVINDDDCLDGFLILDKENRDKEKSNHNIEKNVVNERIKNADEVYIMAQTPEDAKKIDDMNSETNKAKKRVRDKVISEKGIVDEKNLPDVKQKFYMDLNNLARLKGK